MIYHCFLSENGAYIFPVDTRYHSDDLQFAIHENIGAQWIGSSTFLDGAIAILARYK